MRPHPTYLMFLMSLTIVVMVTLTSEAMAQASTNESATSGQASTNESATSGQASTNESVADEGAADEGAADEGAADEGAADESVADGNSTNETVTNGNTTSGQATNEGAASNPEIEEKQLLAVKENGTLQIDQTVVINNFSLPITFELQKNPSHGKVTINGSLLTYTPDKGYTGRDKFSFIVFPFNITTNTTLSGNPSKPQTVTVTVGPKAPLPIPEEWRIPLAFGISLGVVLFIFYISYRIIRRTRIIRKAIIKTKFWDIIRDENWYPSLAMFQFLIWTGIVLFAYFGVALTRFFYGIGPFTEIPVNLIYVMGISAGVPVAGTAISRFQYAGTTPPNVQSTKEVPSETLRKTLPGYKTMLMENGKITLTRFQMFAWTWIGIIAYLGLLYLVTTINLGDIEDFSLPTLPTIFLAVMGISQVTYLGAKSAKPRYFSINEVKPHQIQLKKGNNITVLGSNFGTNGTVWLEYYPPLSSDERPHPTEEEETDKEAAELYLKKCDDELRYDPTRKVAEFDITPKKDVREVKRQDNRIVVSLDPVLDKLKLDELKTGNEKVVREGTDGRLKYTNSDAKRFVVRVERDGLLTYANSDATFDITAGPTPTIIEESTPTIIEESTPTTTTEESTPKSTEKQKNGK